MFAISSETSLLNKMKGVTIVYHPVPMATSKYHLMGNRVILEYTFSFISTFLYTEECTCVSVGMEYIANARGLYASSQRGIGCKHLERWEVMKILTRWRENKQEVGLDLILTWVVANIIQSEHLNLLGDVQYPIPRFITDSPSQSISFSLFNYLLFTFILSIKKNLFPFISSNVHHFFSNPYPICPLGVLSLWHTIYQQMR